MGTEFMEAWIEKFERMSRKEKLETIDMELTTLKIKREEMKKQTRIVNCLIVLSVITLIAGVIFYAVA
jgi:3-dehydroquinate dehydratase